MIQCSIFVIWLGCGEEIRVIGTYSRQYTVQSRTQYIDHGILFFIYGKVLHPFYALLFIMMNGQLHVILRQH